LYHIDKETLYRVSEHGLCPYYVEDNGSRPTHKGL
jgi:hypothetical protein